MVLREDDAAFRYEKQTAFAALLECGKSLSGERSFVDGCNPSPEQATALLAVVDGGAIWHSWRSCNAAD